MIFDTVPVCICWTFPTSHRALLDLSHFFSPRLKFVTVWYTTHPLHGAASWVQHISWPHQPSLPRSASPISASHSPPCSSALQVSCDCSGLT